MDVKINFLKKCEEVEDGRPHVGYMDFYRNVWATPIDLFGSEIYEALNAKLDKTIVFEVRYCKKVQEIWENSKSFVIGYNGSLYDIYHVSMKRNERKMVVIKANRQS